MLKKILFAAAVTGLVAGVALPLATTAEAAQSGCRAAAKAKFPGTGPFNKARNEYRKECKAHYKSFKTAQKGAKKAA